jgi:CrcB protein
VTTFAIALGAAVGGPARYVVARALDMRAPGQTHGGTLLVNLLGSAFLGWLVGHGVEGRELSLFGTGFCGAFTTYSAVAVQSVNSGGWRGPAYAVVTVLGCLGTAWTGYSLG